MWAVESPNIAAIRVAGIGLASKAGGIESGRLSQLEQHTHYSTKRKITIRRCNGLVTLINAFSCEHRLVRRCVFRKL
jgi:hypothetical protein